MARGEGGHPRQQREKSLDRRVTVTGIVVNAVVAIVVAVIAAYGTAHSSTIINVLGGTPRTVTASPPSAAPSDNSQPSSSQPGAVQMPNGPAFTERGVLIGNQGIDLDRNPPEQGNVSTGAIELQGGYGLTLVGYSAQEVATWAQADVLTQGQCHTAELTKGVNNLQDDLTTYQSTGQVARFCVLTSEGRDAYVAIPGKTLVADSPIPADVFVWPSKIPVS